VAKSKNNIKRLSNTVRIIGGRHRGRKLSFPDVDGLRPTIDRVRETLFNWLQPIMPGATCLDLFAGSGVLGLEALSRGAAVVDFVDSSAKAISQIKHNLELLKETEKSHTFQINAAEFTSRSTVTNINSYDVVFLDPPFANDLLNTSLTDLIKNNLLSKKALIYLEQDSHHDWAELPLGWTIKKQGKAGQAAYRLIEPISDIACNKP